IAPGTIVFLTSWQNWFRKFLMNCRWTRMRRRRLATSGAMGNLSCTAPGRTNGTTAGTCGRTSLLASCTRIVSEWNEPFLQPQTDLEVRPTESVAGLRGCCHLFAELVTLLGRRCAGVAHGVALGVAEAVEAAAGAAEAAVRDDHADRHAGDR